MKSMEAYSEIEVTFIHIKYLLDIIQWITFKIYRPRRNISVFSTL